ncbi:MAG: hypothetical protein R2911_13985 [Caldilineaceae bacterium]
MFNSVNAIKVAHAEERIVAHFAQLNDQRRMTVVWTALSPVHRDHEPQRHLH